MKNEDRITLLELQVKGINDLLSVTAQRDTLNLANEQMDDAKVMALYTVVQAGIHQEEFRQHFETRFDGGTIITCGELKT